MGYIRQLVVEVFCKSPVDSVIGIGDPLPFCIDALDQVGGLIIAQQHRAAIRVVDGDAAL